MLQSLGPVKKLVHTITADNGKEFAGHATVAGGLCAGFYFATPYHSWERGLNEHTNGLVREFFPKSQDLRKVDPGEVRGVQEMLNTRPRRVVGLQNACRGVLQGAGGRWGEEFGVRTRSVFVQRVISGI